MKTILKILIIVLLVFTNSSAWQNTLLQDYSLHDVKVLNDSQIFAVGDSGTVIKTVDFGANWEIKHKAANRAETLNSIHCVNSQMAWAVGNSGTIIKTENGGKHG